jgi:hypothetical protein
MVRRVDILAPVRGIAEDLPFWSEFDIVSSTHHVAVTAPLIWRTDSSLPDPQFAATGVIIDVHLPWRIAVSGGYIGGYLQVSVPQRAGSRIGVPQVAITKTFALRRLVASHRSVFDDFHGFGMSGRRATMARIWRR